MEKGSDVITRTNMFQSENTVMAKDEWEQEVMS